MIDDDFTLTHVERARRRAATARVVEVNELVNAGLDALVAAYESRNVEITDAQRLWLRDVVHLVALAVLRKIPTPLRVDAHDRDLTVQHLSSIVATLEKLIVQSTDEVT